MLGFRRDKSESNTTSSTSSETSAGSVPPRHLGELLFNEGLIDQDQLNQALAQQKQEDTYLGQVLVNMNIISQEALTSFLVKQCKIPHLSLQDYDIGSDVLSLVPQDICEKHRLLPIDKLGRILTVAMVDPLNAEALEEVKKACPDLRIKPILCDWRHFEQVSEKVFQKNDGGKPVTMQSFGLSVSNAPAKKVEPQKPPVSSPTSESKSVSTESNTVPGLNAQELASVFSQSLREMFGDTLHQGSKPDTQTMSQEAIVQALRETMQDSMSELAGALKASASVPVDSMNNIKPEELAALLRDSIGSALHAPITALTEEIRASKVTQESAAPSLSNDDIAHIIREGVSDTLQDAMATLLVQLRATSNTNNLTAEDIGNSIRESLNDTMQEVLAVFSAQIHAAQSSKSNSTSAFDPDQMASVLKESIREGLQDVLSMSQTTQSEHAASSSGSSSSITPESLAEIMRDSFGSVMQEAMSALHMQLQTAHSSNPASNESFQTEQIAIVLKDSIREGIQEVLNTTAHPASQAGKQPPESPSAFTPELMTEIMRDSVGGAMQEAVAAMVVQLRAMMGKREQHEESLVETREQLVSALQAGMQDVVAATREAHMQQESRLAELAEATLLSAQQTSHLIETSVVAQNTQYDLYRGRRVRHASVTPFTIVQSKAQIPAKITNPEELEEADAQVREALESEQPQVTLTFDSFLPGSVNTFTFKVSQAVSAHPGGEYNPFFLFGNVGIGKTHLINAIGNAILHDHPNMRVGYVSASHFSKRLADAMKDEALDAFREGYCHWDVLILDDIQFMGGRVETQEEFFHIFNVLHQQARQIIIASDKAPDHLGLLEKRLVSRFASGIVAELKAPEWETRMAILRMHAKQAGTTVPDEILSLIAMRVPNDIRKMTGSLRKVLAYADLVGQDITCEMASDILSHLSTVEAA